MAKKLTADNDTGKGTSAGHNITNINAAIRGTLDKVLDVEAQIATAKETHIKPLTDAKNKLMRDLKQHDIPAKVLRAYLALLREAEKARDFEDDKDKKKTIDAMDLVFEAVYGGTPEGQTVSIIDVLDRLSIDPADQNKKNGKGAAADVNSAPAGNA